jgi:hypothetical protein
VLSLFNELGKCVSHRASELVGSYTALYVHRQPANLSSAVAKTQQAKHATDVHIKLLIF